MKPKSAAEIDFQTPPTFETSRFGLPQAAAERKMSQRVRGSPAMSLAILFLPCGPVKVR